MYYCRLLFTESQDEVCDPSFQPGPFSSGAGNYTQLALAIGNAAKGTARQCFSKEQCIAAIASKASLRLSLLLSESEGEVTAKTIGPILRRYGLGLS